MLLLSLLPVCPTTALPQTWLLPSGEAGGRFHHPARAAALAVSAGAAARGPSPASVELQPPAKPPEDTGSSFLFSPCTGAPPAAPPRNTQGCCPTGTAVAEHVSQRPTWTHLTRPLHAPHRAFALHISKSPSSLVQMSSAELLSSSLAPRSLGGGCSHRRSEGPPGLLVVPLCCPSSRAL